VIDTTEPGLDLAWASVEAALPAGWVIWGLKFRARGQWEAWAGPPGGKAKHGYAKTKLGALRALAQLLLEINDEWVVQG
jgi:hypothetical protein